MRIDTALAEWNEYDIFLDGVKIDDCFEADDVSNTVWSYDAESYNGYRVMKGKVEFRKKTPQHDNMLPNEIKAEWIDDPGFIVRDATPFEYKLTLYENQEITGVMIDGTTFQFDAPVNVQAGDTLQLNMEIQQDGTLQMIKLLYNGE